MNKNQIGTNAGIVWNVLKDNNHWEYNDLKAATGIIRPGFECGNRLVGERR